MRGRTPWGPEYVNRLAGSDVAKERLKVVLETLAGTTRVREACERLGICEQRFHQLRQHVMEAGLAAMEPRSAGRPARAASPEDQRIRDLEEQLHDKDAELRAAKVREEVAVILPRAIHGTPAASMLEEELEQQKKKRPRQSRSRINKPR
jgi:transposase